MSIEGINYNGGEKEIVLSYEQERIIKTLLGTDEQIYNKVKASLDALERNQAGSCEIGTSGFYNSMIESGGRKITSGEFNLCKSVIDRFVNIVKNDKAQERDKKDLLGEVDEYHVSLDMEKTEEERKELDKKDASLYGGEEYIDK